MFQYDFSNHQNRHIRITDMPAEYFQRIQETTRKDPYYPVWHIAPKCGLMNDPNGLCEINGIHHIFYQWFPAGPVHGLKHWYHLTTKDFIHYEDHGAYTGDVPGYRIRLLRVLYRNGIKRGRKSTCFLYRN